MADHRLGINKPEPERRPGVFKRLMIVVFIGALVGLGYMVWQQAGEPGRPEKREPQPVRNEAAAQNPPKAKSIVDLLVDKTPAKRVAYSAELGKLTGAVFARLGSSAEANASAIRSFRRTCSERVQANGRDAEAAQAAADLCDKLSTANRRRAAAESALKSLKSKRFEGLGGSRKLDRKGLGGDTADDKRRLFVEAKHASWQEYVKNAKPACDRLLSRIRKRE